MPNNITNILTLSSGKELPMERLLTKEGEFDFNSFIPMPKCLRGKSPSCNAVSRANALLGRIVVPKGTVDRSDLKSLLIHMEFKDQVSLMETRINAHTLEETLDCLQSFQECGYLYWNDFSEENWGTKWNAYDIKIDKKSITFDTAWDAPFPIFERISKLVDEPIHIKYASEDTGSNQGEWMYFKGGIDLSIA